MFGRPNRDERLRVQALAMASEQLAHTGDASYKIAEAEKLLAFLKGEKLVPSCNVAMSRAAVGLARGSQAAA